MLVEKGHPDYIYLLFVVINMVNMTQHFLFKQQKIYLFFLNALKLNVF